MIVATSWVQGKCKASKLYLSKKNTEQKSGKQGKKTQYNTNRKKGKNGRYLNENPKAQSKCNVVNP